MVSKEFFKQLEVVSQERGVTVEQLIEAFKKGLLNAYKKHYGDASARVEIRADKHEIFVYSQRIVVENVEDYDLEDEILPISLEEARETNARARVGDIIESAVNIKDFGRLAAAQAKQILNQNIKTYEKENAFVHFKTFENEMIIAEVIDMNENFVTLSIGQNVTTLLPVKELLPNDHFVIGEKIKVYVVSIEQTPKGPKVFVSRNDKNLVTRLLENNIPEIKEGIIEIRGIARDAGERTKIAVFSHDPMVDPIGSCIGENGARIREVIHALNGEKVDVYRWSEDPATLIANALQPATVVAVINIDPKTKTSLAIVPDDQLSLAIGKSGHNVRLAVQSCDWKIDIKSVSLARDQGYEW